MRILILTFYYEPDLCAGSFRITSFVKELKKMLKESDSVDVLTTLPNRYKSFSKQAKKFESSDKINIKRFEIGKHKSGFIDQSFSFIRYAFQVLNFVRKQKKYDIVLASSSRLMTAFLGAVISNRQKNMLFLDIRDIFTDTLESVFQKKKIKKIIPLFKKIEKFTVNNSDCINLVSEGFYEYFYNLNPDKKYLFYPNGIDEEFLQFDFSKDKHFNQKIITYAGNIGEGQGLEKIIPQMSEFLGNDYIIQIIGDGGTKHKLIESIKNCKNVKLINPISRNELLVFYKNSDFLFLHLNNYKAFEKALPSKIFEYGATNKFIIAGVSGYAKQFIENNVSNSFVFEPCNINDFIRKFKDIDVDITIDRKDFIDKFKRKNIMNKLAGEVYNLI